MKLAARAVLLLSLLAAVFFAAMTTINIHDYYFTDQMPWREGDFQAAMSTGLGGLAFSHCGLLFCFLYLRRP